MLLITGNDIQAMNTLILCRKLGDVVRQRTMSTLSMNKSLASAPAITTTATDDHQKTVAELKAYFVRSAEELERRDVRLPILHHKRSTHSLRHPEVLHSYKNASEFLGSDHCRT